MLLSYSSLPFYYAYFHYSTINIPKSERSLTVFVLFWQKGLV
jgi:hypothetical protein